MNSVVKRTVLLLLLAVLWAVGIWWGVRTIPVGMAFLQGQKGHVSLVSIFPDGREVESPRRTLGEDGVVSFNVDRSAKSFYFRLYNDGDNRSWQLKDIRLYGIPAITAAMTSRFEMQKKLYSSRPTHDDEPLLLTVEDGDAVNLCNVFPYILHVFATIQGIIAALPISLFAMYMAVAFFLCRHGMATWTFVNREGVFFWIVAAVLLLTLPAPVAPTEPGLDPSWEWLMNRFAWEHVFGENFVFTYGPLGFLISPQHYGVNVAVGMAVNILFVFLFGCSVILIHRYRQFDFRCSASHLLLLLWLLDWPNGMEWKWCLTSVTTCALAVFVREFNLRIRLFLFAVAAATSVLLSFVKFSSCISLCGQHVVLLAFGIFRERRQLLSGSIVYSLTAMACIILAMIFLFPSPSSFVAWIRGSFEIAEGYNLVMCTDKPWPELASVLVLTGVLLACILVGKHGRHGVLRYWSLFVPFLFCTYKYAVVRQSANPFLLSIAWLSALSMVIVPERARRSAVMVAFFCGAAACLSIVWRAEIPHLGISMGNLIDNACPLRAMRRAALESKPSVEAARLPSSWLDRIGTNRVMIAGWDMGPAMFGELNLTPFPATQTYSAYTPYLDERCAERVTQEEESIRFLIAPANPCTIDARNIYFDNPRLWRAVRRHYRFVAQNADHVLLERRHGPFPHMAEEEFVFSLSRPILDKIRALLFRPTRAIAHITFVDGTVYHCFANLEVLSGTPVPQDLPIMSKDISSYMDGVSCPQTRIKEIKVIFKDELLFVHNTNNMANTYEIEQLDNKRR